MLKLAATLRIELLHVKPLVWRRFVVPADMQLPKLHKVIHSVMGWEDTHLHEFDIDSERFGVQDKDVSDEGLRSEKGVRLNNALGAVTEFEYRYDFGDDWRHRVIVESVGYPDLALALPACLAGENACPPEDVGGPHGYAQFLAALRDKNHEQHNDFRSWVGGVFDPVGFDVNAVNARLRAIR